MLHVPPVHTWPGVGVGDSDLELELESLFLTKFIYGADFIIGYILENVNKL